MLDWVEGIKQFEPIEIGGQPFRPNEAPLIVAGVCALTDEDTSTEVAANLVKLTAEVGCPAIFKGSYKKDNRTRSSAFRGAGLEKGLELLQAVRERLGIPVLTDVHETDEVERVAAVVDVLQVPSLLCKQTSLLEAVAGTGRVINLKKGQFLTPFDMEHAIDKILRVDPHARVLVTERGTNFGYYDTISDFRAIPVLMRAAIPVLYDPSHAVRVMNRRSDEPEGAHREFMPTLVRCAAAAGADGLFIEAFPDPKLAASDAASCVDLDQLRELVRQFLVIRQARMDLDSSR